MRNHKIEAGLPIESKNSSRDSTNFKGSPPSFVFSHLKSNENELSLENASANQQSYTAKRQTVSHRTARLSSDDADLPNSNSKYIVNSDLSLSYSQSQGNSQLASQLKSVEHINQQMSTNQYSAWSPFKASVDHPNLGLESRVQNIQNSLSPAKINTNYLESKNSFSLQPVMSSETPQLKSNGVTNQIEDQLNAFRQTIKMKLSQGSLEDSLSIQMPTDNSNKPMQISLIDSHVQSSNVLRKSNNLYGYYDQLPATNEKKSQVQKEKQQMLDQINFSFKPPSESENPSSRENPSFRPSFNTQKAAPNATQNPGYTYHAVNIKYSPGSSLPNEESSGGSNIISPYNSNATLPKPIEKQDPKAISTTKEELASEKIRGILRTSSDSDIFKTNPSNSQPSSIRTSLKGELPNIYNPYVANVYSTQVRQTQNGETILNRAPENARAAYYTSNDGPILNKIIDHSLPTYYPPSNQPINRVTEYSSRPTYYPNEGAILHRNIDHPVPTYYPADGVILNRVNHTVPTHYPNGGYIPNMATNPPLHTYSVPSNGVIPNVLTSQTRPIYYGPNRNTLTQASPQRQRAPVTPYSAPLSKMAITSKSIRSPSQMLINSISETPLNYISKHVLAQSPRQSIDNFNKQGPSVETGAQPVGNQNENIFKNSSFSQRLITPTTGLSNNQIIRIKLQEMESKLNEKMFESIASTKALNIDQAVAAKQQYVDLNQDLIARLDYLLRNAHRKNAESPSRRESPNIMESSLNRVKSTQQLGDRNAGRRVTRPFPIFAESNNQPVTAKPHGVSIASKTKRNSSSEYL